jgi:predicted hotdog family 3-hydroxylacyl-ACP dehydratase
MSVDRDRLLALIPHAGNMCLLDRVVAYSDEDIECTARTHEDPGHPLRRNGRLSALHLVEYAAQAMAAHGALRSGGGIQRGMLAALRDVRLHVETVDGISSELTIRATRRIAQGTGSLYDFSVRAGNRVLCEGRLAIIHP